MDTVSKESDLSSEIVSQASYIAMTSIVSRICGVLFSVFIARSLGSISLGIYSIIFSTISLFVALFSLGLGVTAEKTISQYYLTDLKYVGRLLGLVLSLFLLLTCSGTFFYFLATPFLSKVYPTVNFYEVILPSIILLMVMSFNSIFESILFGFQKIRLSMIINSVTSILLLLFALVVLLSMKGSSPVQLLLYAYALSQTCKFIFLILGFISSVNSLKIKISFLNLQELVVPVLFKLSLPVFINKILEQPLSWVSILLLAKLAGNISYVGGITVINYIKAWIIYLPSMFIPVYLPLLSRLYGNENKKNFIFAISFNFKLLWIMTLPPLLFTIINCKVILRYFFGLEYLVFGNACAILLSTTIFTILNELNDRTMIATGNVWASLCFRIVFWLMLLSGICAFVPSMGLDGYAIVFLVSYFIYVLMQTIWIMKVINFENVTLKILILVISIVSLWLAYILLNMFSGVYVVIIGLIISSLMFIIGWNNFFTVNEKMNVYEDLKRVPFFKFIKFT